MWIGCDDSMKNTDYPTDIILDLTEISPKDANGLPLGIPDKWD